MPYKDKEKRKQYLKQWRQENKEYKKLLDKQYYEKKGKAQRKLNKEHIAAYRRKWNADNPDKIKQQAVKWHKKYYVKNKVQILDKYKVFIKMHRKKINCRYNEAKRSAHTRGMLFNLTLEEYTRMIEAGICTYCEKSLDTTGGNLDRKNNEAYYTLDSVVPCCKRCNLVFNRFFSYEEKLKLGKVIREIDDERLRNNDAKQFLTTTSNDAFIRPPYICVA